MHQTGKLDREFFEYLAVIGRKIDEKVFFNSPSLRNSIIGGFGQHGDYHIKMLLNFLRVYSQINNPGFDRIARNGDTANKIGTFQLAIIAKYFGIPFYVAAPLTTIDFECENGKAITVEES